MESKLFRRWGKERGMFRDDHFDNGYAAHRLFTEKFGDFTPKRVCDNAPNARQGFLG